MSLRTASVLNGVTVACFDIVASPASTLPSRAMASLKLLAGTPASKSERASHTRSILPSSQKAFSASRALSRSSSLRGCSSLVMRHTSQSLWGAALPRARDPKRIAATACPLATAWRAASRRRNSVIGSIIVSPARVHSLQPGSPVAQIAMASALLTFALLFVHDRESTHLISTYSVTIPTLTSQFQLGTARAGKRQVRARGEHADELLDGERRAFVRSARAENTLPLRDGVDGLLLQPRARGTPLQG